VYILPAKGKGPCKWLDREKTTGEGEEDLNPIKKAVVGFLGVEGREVHWRTAGSNPSCAGRGAAGILFGRRVRSLYVRTSGLQLRIFINKKTVGRALMGGRNDRSMPCKEMGRVSQRSQCVLQRNFSKFN